MHKYTAALPKKFWQLLFAPLACLWISAPRADAFEQDHRINGLTLKFGTDTFAVSNRFGSAFASFGQAEFQQMIVDRIASGETSLIFTMGTLADLSGTTQPSVQLGVVNGTPFLPPGNPNSYSGGSDLDWWYPPNANEIDSFGVPTASLPASFASRVFNAGPGRLTFTATPFAAAGAPGWLAMSGVLLRANVGSSSTPLRSTNNFPPGHRPGENVDPALTSFAAMSQGQLRGNISAASLAGTPIPSSLVGSSTSSGFTANNSFLDLIVNGARTLGGLLTVVIPTQPDTADPAAPLPGAGPPYRFTVNSLKVVTGCRDKNNVAVDLTLGLNAAAYSASFAFTTDRVILLSPPDIAVEQPFGTNLVTGDNKSFGTVPLGFISSLTFTIKNTGLADLSGINTSIGGGDAASFTVTAAPSYTVSGANGSTTFTVQFAPTNAGPKTAILHIISNDPNESPFDLSLNGTGSSVMAPYLTGLGVSSNGSFQVAFTNYPGTPFTILSATNIDLPLTNWTSLGAPTETSAGVFEFNRGPVTNEARRFFRVRSP